MWPAQLSSRIFLCTTWLGACRLTLFSLTGWAEEQLQHLAVSFLSINLYSSSKTSIMPLLSSHTHSGKWEIGVFHALKNIPNQKVRFSMGSPGHLSGFHFEYLYDFSIRPERQRREEWQGPRVLWSFQVTVFLPWAWVSKKERRQRKGKTWNENQRALSNCSSFLEHWWENKRKGRWNTQREFSEHFQGP